MKGIKGPINDKKVYALLMLTAIVGSLLVLMALITWPWELIRKRQNLNRQSPSPSARDRARKALQEARENCFNYDDHRKQLYVEVNSILRIFLKEAFDLKVANRPSMKMANQLKESPFYEELKGLVSRINRVIYEGDAPDDVEAMMKQFDELLQRMDGSTPFGVNHDKAG